MQRSGYFACRQKNAAEALMPQLRFFQPGIGIKY